MQESPSPSSSGGPALMVARPSRWPLRHVVAYRSRRHPYPELDRQLIGHSLFSPQRIIARHPSNKLSQLERLGHVKTARKGVRELLNHSSPSRPSPLVRRLQMQRWVLTQLLGQKIDECKNSRRHILASRIADIDGSRL